MIIKLDMANAFDRVNHHFLREVLRKLGISNNFISIIMECNSHPWTAPLINGRPSSYFRSSRGLRQGCPISPFLYIIMEKTLSIHLEKLRKKKEITGISIERGIKEINHSLFANDTLLIEGASSLMAKIFKKILDTFLTALGGRLNNKKCKIYTWNVPLQIMQRMSTIVDIPLQRNWSYFSYLGLPLAKETVKSEIWGGRQDSKKFSLVRWDQVILPFEKGGLGIKILSLYNKAMGFKLIWRMLIGKGSWWVEVIKRKYLNGLNSNVLSKAIVERPCTPVWKLIKKVLPQFRNHVSKVPGNGNEINIWSDRIMGAKPRNLIQNLRPLQTWMEAKNLNFLYDISLWDHNSWNDWKGLSPPNDLRDLWIELKISLSGSAPTNKMADDRYVWDPSGGKFTVKEGHKLLQDTIATNKWNLYKVVWKSECLPKIKFFN
eukprot:PITA_16655